MTLRISLLFIVRRINQTMSARVFKCQSGWRVLLISLACSFPSLACAFTYQDRGDPDGLPVVLTPSRLPQRLDEAPNAITVIDRAMIEASGARRLEEVLRLVPGVQVGHKYNNQPTVAYHGLSDEFARRVLVLVNGQRIFQYSAGAVDWNNIPIPLSDIERIEVIRGPSAAAYGSNALTAVINIQTGSAREYAGGSFQGGIGTNRTADALLRWGGRAGPVDMALSVASSGEGGYTGIHDSRRNTLLLFKSEFPLSDRGELQLTAGYARGAYEAQNANPVYPDTFERDFTNTNSFASLQWRQSFSMGDELLVSLSHNRVHHGDPGFSSSSILPGVTLKVDFQFEEVRDELQLQYVRHFSDQWRGVAGMGYFRDGYRSLYYLNIDDPVVTGVTQFFGHGEYRFSDSLVFNVGAMVERAPLSDDWLFLPRLSAHWHVADHQTLRAIYTTGSRQPSIFENQGQAVIRGVNVPLTLWRVYATGIERGGLLPERSRSIELGYLWEPAPAINLDLRLFHERIDDGILPFGRLEKNHPTITPGNYVVDFRNNEPVSVQGLETQVNWQNQQGTRLFAGYAWLHVDEQDSGASDRKLAYSRATPSHAASLLLSQEFGAGWQASLAYNYQSAMRWMAESPIHAYHNLTGRVAKRVHWGNTSGLAEVIAGNLMEPVHDYLTDRSWERGLYVRFSFDY